MADTNRVSTDIVLVFSANDKRQISSDLVLIFHGPNQRRITTDLILIFSEPGTPPPAEEEVLPEFLASVSQVFSPVAVSGQVLLDVIGRSRPVTIMRKTRTLGKLI